MKKTEAKTTQAGAKHNCESRRYCAWMGGLRLRGTINVNRKYIGNWTQLADLIPSRLMLPFPTPEEGLEKKMFLTIQDKNHFASGKVDSVYNIEHKQVPFLAVDMETNVPLPVKSAAWLKATALRKRTN